MKHKSQQGVALVLTLILLSVITFLAITFLALSRREKGAVTTTTEQTMARLASETALERAKAQIVANLLARNNKSAYDLMVSTNYINPLGFRPGDLDPTNVSYVNLKGQPLDPGTPVFAQAVSNLFYDPRPPVFIVTNRNQIAPAEFRYYVDLNRNGRYDTNGFLPVIGPNGGFLYPDATEHQDPAGAVRSFFVGDPEWVGDLERPGLPHSGANLFVDRWAYLVVPSGKALDLNHIFNQAKHGKLVGNPRGAAYYRNQNVGTWEINLAAFLRDLNTNAWNSYFYQATNSTSSFGAAFADAVSLLTYRYGPDYYALMSVHDYYQGRADGPFGNDAIDEYPASFPPTGVALPRFVNEDVTAPWPGANNTNQFFTTQELFDPAKTSPVFTNNLQTAGMLNSSYDRYTFYRLLSAMGTDAAPEPDGKINLNYNSLHGLSATNLVPWDPGDFFTNTADRFLKDPALAGSALAAYPGLSVTNIPVWPVTNNFYSPAVHRLLQLAANIYDSTVTNTYPSLFRPIFAVSNGTVRVSGYRHDLDVRDYTNPKQWYDLRTLAAAPNGEYRDVLIYGIPVVVGAKKGFPNFNEVAVQNIALVSRKLQLVKDRVGGRITQTNQMYVVGVTNVLGIEAWNSYLPNYPRALALSVAMDVQTVLHNAKAPPGNIVYSNTVSFVPAPTAIAPNTWRGYSGFDNTSFKVPIAGGYTLFTNSIYWQDRNGGGILSGARAGFQPQNTFGFPVPELWLSTTNRVRYILVDTTAGRIVDLVSLDGLGNTMDVSAILGANSIATGIDGVWRTNRLGSQTVDGLPQGVREQIEVSLGNASAGSDWRSASLDSLTGQDKQKAIDAFRVFCGLSPIYYPSMVRDNTNRIMQAPFNPSRRFYQHSSWQANDPLVHYTASDLTDLGRTNDVNFIVPPAVIQPDVLLQNLGRVNTRYNSWPIDPTAASTDPDAFNLRLKDPMVRRSDDWDFPTNKLPNIGWLGRVHRGTPWQTVYLKAWDVAPAAWQRWTGDGWASRLGASVFADAATMRPVSDWAIFEHFSTAPNENATRGQLSVNQGQLPAWSAVLSGVAVLTNIVPNNGFSNPRRLPEFGALFVEPAGADGLNSPLGRIWDGINRERTRTVTNNVGGKLVVSYVHSDTTFWRLGDILSVPELTVASPYLNLSSIQQQRGLTDAAYERIPQQILSLLRGDDNPRFVVYAYGQALKPAPRSIVTAGPYIGLCTNYQIMAETATRAVVRVDGDPNPKANRPLRAVVESFNLLPPD